MASIKAKITKRLVDSLKPDAAGDLFVWDSELSRFGLRIKPSGRGSFFILYRPGGRAQRYYTFAKLGTVTPEQARDRARRLLISVDDGEDPAAEKQEAKAALSVADLCAAYIEAARAGQVITNKRRAKAASTLAVDEGRIARHIVPLIGHHVATSLAGRADILQRMHDDIAGGKTAATVKTGKRGLARVTGGATAAKRAVGLLGGIWTWAARRKMVAGVNPARGVVTEADATRDSFLDDKALAALGAAIREVRDVSPMAGDVLILIALTGLRADEAAGLRWRDIDAENSCLRLEATKTGKSTRAIGAAARAHIGALPKFDDLYLFPNRAGTGRAELKTPIAKIFDAAGLHAERAQTLRRTFASVAADEGYSDATIGELLGHARRGVTSRHYIRRPDAALVAAADAVSARIAAAMGITSP
jgi:integrase